MCMSKQYPSCQPVTTLHLQSAGGPIWKVSDRELGTAHAGDNYWESTVCLAWCWVLFSIMHSINVNIVCLFFSPNG